MRSSNARQGYHDMQSNTLQSSGLKTGGGIKKPRLLSHDKQGSSKSYSIFVPIIKTNNSQQSYKSVSKKQPRLLNSLGKAIKIALVVMVFSGISYNPLNTPGHRFGTTVSIASAWGDSSVEVWWPVDGSKVTGKQPFKAMVNTMTVDKYRMVWQVDGGQQNEMPTNFMDYPHKESLVDLSGWDWKGSGPYTLSFTGYDENGNKVGTKYETIYLNVSEPTPSVASGNPITQPVADVTTVVSQAVNQQIVIAQTEQVPETKKLDVWWPTNGASVSGTIALKMMLENAAISDYRAYWQVDGGALKELDSNYNDYPHKESSVDVSGWNWKGKGPYAITFIAQNKNGQEIGRSAVSVTIPTQTVQSLVNQPQGSTQIVSKPSSVVSNNPFSGAQLYVDPNTDTAQWARSHANSNAYEAQLMDKLAQGAETQWFGNWNDNIKKDVNDFVTSATRVGALPTVVAYNIPNRDCGGYSAGGADADSYRQWIRNFAQGIGNRKAVVILEPDALALTSCLSEQDLQSRYALLQDAVQVLKSNGQSVYIDAGHPGWIAAGEMVGRLNKSGIEQANGFALNVSNFATTDENITYGTTLSNQLNGKHFIVDTSRNGNGAPLDGAWCNPSGRSLGQKPTVNTGNALVDAFLWVKGPGGSDGDCNGGPSAGQFWPGYALALARNTSW